jgi:hypothetical protein
MAKKKSNEAVMLLVAALVITAVGGGVAYLLMEKKKKKKAPAGPRPSKEKYGDTQVFVKPGKDSNAGKFVKATWPTDCGMWAVLQGNTVKTGTNAGYCAS